MNTLNVSCLDAGCLYFPSSFNEVENTTIDSRNLADYTVTSAEQLHTLAKSYSKVSRSGNVIMGSAYTLEMAENDFNIFSKKGD